jgi:hypothetical protein
MGWVGNVGKWRGACRVLVEKPERKNAHGKPKCRCVDRTIILKWILKTLNGEKHELD